MLKESIIWSYMKDGLTVCIIAKNEEKMLEDCLKSILGYVDEIILVDTGSIDKTKEIALKYGCNIYDFQWINDFSAARNFSINQANFENILILDADERVLNPAMLKIEIMNSPEIIGGWLVELESIATRKDGTKDRFASNLLRMFRNKPEIRFSGAIHEQIIDSIIGTNLKLRNTNIKISHLGYDLSAEEMASKQNRNLKLLLENLKQNGNDAYLLYQTAKTYFALKDLDNAEYYIQNAILNSTANNLILPQCLNYGASIAVQNKDIDTAIERAKKSVDIIPNQTFANYILAESYNSKSDIDSALKYYIDALNYYDEKETYAQIVGDYKPPVEQICFRIGRCYISKDNRTEAGKYFELGIKYNPYNIPCLVGKANIHYALNQFSKALEVLEKANNIESNRSDIMKYIEQTKAAMMNSNNETIKSIEINANSPLISLSMIVKNEEKMLAGCLDSVRNLVDEIIIVDTGSSDKTVEIAKRYGAKVHYFDWIDDFAAARNESLKHCRGQWILYLDADERLKPIDIARLRQMLANAHESVGGVICTIESQHQALTGDSELHRGGYPRLFKNLGFPKVKFAGRVHEQISPSLRENGYSLANSDISILHLGYDRPREEMEEKVKRNYKLLLQHVKEEPVNGYAWYQLGQTLAHMKLMKEAEDAIRFAIQCGNLSNSIASSAYATLSQLCGSNKNFQEALNLAEKSLMLAPDQLYPTSLKGYALLHLGRLDEAEIELKKAKSYIGMERGTPLSGFDIDLPEDIIEKGLQMIRDKREKL